MKTATDRAGSPRGLFAIVVFTAALCYGALALLWQLALAPVLLQGAATAPSRLDAPSGAGTDAPPHRGPAGAARRDEPEGGA